MQYRYTQSSFRPALIALPALVAVGVGITLAEESNAVWYWPMVAIIAVVGIGASRLTTTVGGGEVRATFSFGWPSRTIDVADIAGARVVRNRWYQGFGVRLIRGGWMYNVYGLDAVELDLANGRKFRIGTDEPEALHAAIDEAISGRG